MLLAHHPPHTPPGEREAKPDEPYEGMVRYLDKLVGRVMEALRKNRLERETLVVFLGDNGSKDRGKDSIKDSGTRLPSFIRWPDQIEAGLESDALIDFSDFLPTLVEAAGGKVTGTEKIDGRSFLPLLKGDGPAPRNWVFSGVRERYFVRDDRWKLTYKGRIFDMHEPERGAERYPAPASPESDRARAKLGEIMVELGLGEPPVREEW
jgi:arylsulfatase A